MAKQHSPGFVRVVESVRGNICECSISEFKAKFDSQHPPVLIDVREASEFAAGHVPGAIHLSKGIIERDIEERFPDLSTELHLMCGGGYRSALAADNLQKMGYTRIVSVDGGWRGWTEAGFPVEQ